MQVIEKVDESKMIVEFLRAEYNSPRYYKKIQSILSDLSISPEVIKTPKINNKNQNEQRLNILKKLKGYGANEGMFYGFPRDIDWYTSKIKIAELQKFKYMNYSQWQYLTSDTRSISDGLGELNKRDDKQDLLKNVETIRKKYLNGENLPKIIAVSTSLEPSAKKVIVEGHARATAFCDLPNNEIITILMGVSKSVKNWKNY